MRALLALVLVTSACFPESARHRRYAKVVEGGLLVGGIALQFAAKKGPCMERPAGAIVADCDQSIAHLDTIGLIMIFAGLAGFAATTLSAEMPVADVPDDEAARATPARDVWATPSSFCAALWAGAVATAEAAVSTHLKSVGAISIPTASDALHAWLPRQPCVVVHDDPGAHDAEIAVHISVREKRYTIDFSSTPHVFLTAN